MKKLFVWAVLLTVVALVAGPATAGSKGQGRRYSGTLTATPNVVHVGDHFDVEGCGYDTSLGNVIVGFASGGWGAALDPATGCFEVTGIPALSGDTLAPGTYEVGAYQYVRGKLRETGETTVTVIA